MPHLEQKRAAKRNIGGLGYLATELVCTSFTNAPTALQQNITEQHKVTLATLLRNWSEQPNNVRLDTNEKSPENSRRKKTPDFSEVGVYPNNVRG